MSSTTTTTTTLPSTSTACTQCGHPNPTILTLQSDLDAALSRVAELEQHIKTLALTATSAMDRATELETSLKRATSQNRTDSQRPSLDKNRRMEKLDEDNISPRTLPQHQQNDSNAPSLSFRNAKSPAGTPGPSTATNPIPSSFRFPRLFPGKTLTLPQSQSQAQSPLPALPSSSSAPSYFTHPGTSQSAMAQTPGGTPSMHNDISLLSALTHEQTLRMAAESAYAKTTTELEDLTSSLFEEANQMVAAERKARAKLEERVEVLEKRDGEKAKRLGVLEIRVQRVERVRNLLLDKAGSASATTTGKEGLDDSR